MFTKSSVKTDYNTELLLPKSVYDADFWPDWRFGTDAFALINQTYSKRTIMTSWDTEQKEDRSRNVGIRAFQRRRHQTLTHLNESIFSPFLIHFVLLVHILSLNVNIVYVRVLCDFPTRQWVHKENKSNTSLCHLI